MIQGSLADVIGLTPTLRNNRVGGAGEYDRAVEILIAEHFGGFIDKPVVAGHVQVEGSCPLLVDNLSIRRSREDRGSVDDHVYATECGDRGTQSAAYGASVTDVNADCSDALLRARLLRQFASVLCPLFITIGYDYMCASARGQFSRGATDSARSPDNQGDSPAQL